MNEAKNELRPFEEIFARAYDEIVELARASDSTRLREAIAALSETNCSWLLYDAARLVRNALPQEVA